MVFHHICRKYVGIYYDKRQSLCMHFTCISNTMHLVCVIFSCMFLCVLNFKWIFSISGIIGGLWKLNSLNNCDNYFKWNIYLLKNQKYFGCVLDYPNNLGKISWETDMKK
jgi:hypothetical protein